MENYLERIKYLANYIVKDINGISNKRYVNEMCSGDLQELEEKLNRIEIDLYEIINRND